jgi:GrpB-like predicted nucleotidyltransferase (UPF0157 family)
MDEILLTPYDPTWSALFENEASLLRRSFSGQEISIEHIGSTAVSGLDAKPIIDIMIGFQKMNPNDVVEKIEALGYEHWKEDTFQHVRLFFIKWGPVKKSRLMQIHATTIHNDFWNDQIAFRDSLRADHGLAKEYVLLKRKLAEKYQNDRDGYTSAKTKFVREVLRL